MPKLQKNTQPFQTWSFIFFFYFYGSFFPPVWGSGYPIRIRNTTSIYSLFSCIHFLYFFPNIQTVKTLNSAVMTATSNNSSSSSGGGGGGSPEGPQFSCLDCAMDFYSAPQLKRHTQYAHRGGEEETQFCQVRLRHGPNILKDSNLNLF